ncbi:unnamed protein product [Pedinophyceae sp. YPF-701]|nr:unnamed protein product [Pedinophyceae sp. YPF-701]
MSGRDRKAKAEKAPPKPSAEDMKPSELMGALTKKTPFSCMFSFMPDLVEPPCSSKLIVEPLRHEEVARFALTQAERNRRYGLPVDLVDAVPLSVLDCSAFQVRPGASERDLHPDDQAILDLAGGAKRRKVGAADTTLATGHEWMRANVPGLHVDGGDSIGARALAQRLRATKATRVTRLDLVGIIEEQFEAAQRPPKHPTKPDLEPVEVHNILPDLRGLDVAVLRCDVHPTLDAAALRGEPDERRRALARSGVFKSLKVEIEGSEEPLPLVAYLCKEAPEVQDPDAAIPAAVLEGRATWLQHYQHSYRKDGRVLLRADPDGTVRFTQVPRLTELRRMRQTDDDAFPRPRHVSIKRRRVDDADLDKAERARDAMFGEMPEGAVPMVWQELAEADFDELPDSESSEDEDEDEEMEEPDAREAAPAPAEEEEEGEELAGGAGEGKEGAAAQPENSEDVYAAYFGAGDDEEDDDEYEAPATPQHSGGGGGDEGGAAEEAGEAGEGGGGAGDES